MNELNQIIQRIQDEWEARSNRLLELNQGNLPYPIIDIVEALCAIAKYRPHLLGAWHLHCLKDDAVIMVYGTPIIAKMAISDGGIVLSGRLKDSHSFKSSLKVDRSITEYGMDTIADFLQVMNPTIGLLLEE